MWRVVRKVVDPSIHLGGDISSFARHPAWDVQAHTQRQYTQHCQITGRTGVTERERGGTGGWYTAIFSFSF